MSSRLPMGVATRKSDPDIMNGWYLLYHCSFVAHVFL
jgi:hypothetical protein